jgi:hypothetical protein
LSDPRRKIWEGFTRLGEEERVESSREEHDCLYFYILYMFALSIGIIDIALGYNPAFL